MNRRAFLRAALGGTALVTIAGCSTPTAIPAAVAQAATIVEDFGPAVVNAVQAAASLLPAAVVTDVETWGGDLVTLATQLASAPTVAAGTSTLVTIEGLANEVVTALGTVSGLPASVASIVDDIKIALPIAEEVLGLVSTPASARMRATAPPDKTLAQALAELKQVAGR